MLWAAFVESPFAHARILRLDLEPARAMHGVCAVLSADDIGRARFGRQLCDWPVLATERVRFIGDRVAAIAAETREAAEAAARAVRVEYEPLPAVVDVQGALAPGAPILHPDRDSYHFFTPDHRLPTPAHPNAYALLIRTVGETDLEPLFARAHRVFEHTFHTSRQLAGFIEPRATLVWIDGDVVHLHTPNKGPFPLRRQFAHATGLREDQVVVEPAAIGGDFGGKGFTCDELPCYFLARATGRPVRYLATYAEEVRRGPTRHQTTIRLRTAVAVDGSLIAHESHVMFDGGAYAAPKPIPTLLPGNAYAAIPYRVPNVRLEINGVYTNTLPGAHVRGPADLQTFTAWESHIDAIARELGADPIAFRRQNVVHAGEHTLAGERIDRPAAVDVLDAIERARRRPPAPGSGRGVALVCAHTGSGKTAVRLRRDSHGNIEATIGAVDQGAGVATVVQRVVATALDIDVGRIAVVRANTRDALPDPGSGHSRITHIVGRAALDAAERLRACDPGPAEVVGTFVSDHGEQVPGDLTFGACALDVDVDAETGTVHVRDALMVVDVGQIVNPIAHQGQIDGGFAFGFGSALFEIVAVDDDGRVTTASLADYKLPTIADLPPLRTVLIRGPDGDGPFGTRMIGELCNVAVPAAALNAVSDALGVRLTRIPLHAEDVWAACSDQTEVARD
jgi:CO/xanthine dehydrogenase Mo-binding subunit